jgi:hypothetical protein
VETGGLGVVLLAGMAGLSGQLSALIFELKFL